METPPTPTPQSDFVTPVEAFEFLSKQMHEGLDTRYQIAAAQGIVNYYLAREIAGLVDFLTQQLMSQGPPNAGEPQ